MERDTTIAHYTAALDSLVQQFRHHELTHIHVNARPIGDTEGLHNLACAAGVGVDTRKQCPDGGGTEILREIVDWIDDPSPTAPRIFWLHGQAGKGKSATAHTIALHARNQGKLGSCFCFAQGRQAERLHEKLFPTIARDLAARDIRLKPILADALAVDPPLGSTCDITQQWKKFIFEPLSGLKVPMVGNVVIVIDALDKSGGDTSRKDILRLFRSAEVTKLPCNLRILLTSRPESDICKKLNDVSHIKSRSVDDTESTTGDIRSIKSSWLRMICAAVFPVDHLACDFIRSQHSFFFF